MKEAIWERVEQSSLCKKEGHCFLLSHVEVSILKQLPRRTSHDQTDPQSSAQSDEEPVIGLHRQWKLCRGPDINLLFTFYLIQLDVWEHS